MINKLVKILLFIIMCVSTLMINAQVKVTPDGGTPLPPGYKDNVKESAELKIVSQKIASGRKLMKEAQRLMDKGYNDLNTALINEASVLYINAAAEIELALSLDKSFYIQRSLPYNTAVERDLLDLIDRCEKNQQYKKRNTEAIEAKIKGPQEIYLIPQNVVVPTVSKTPKNDNEFWVMGNYSEDECSTINIDGKQINLNQYEFDNFAYISHIRLHKTDGMAMSLNLSYVIGFFNKKLSLNQRKKIISIDYNTAANIMNYGFNLQSTTSYTGPGRTYVIEAPQNCDPNPNLIDNVEEYYDEVNRYAYPYDGIVLPIRYYDWYLGRIDSYDSYKKVFEDALSNYHFNRWNDDYNNESTNLTSAKIADELWLLPYGRVVKYSMHISDFDEELLKKYIMYRRKSTLGNFEQMEKEHQIILNALNCKKIINSELLSSYMKNHNESMAWLVQYSIYLEHDYEKE
jgi:hypothetical protein